MSALRNFVTSLKEDLLGRRLLPFLLVLGVALVAAVAYALLSGGSTPATPVTASAGPSSPVVGVAVSSAPTNPNEPVSETTSGIAKQHRGVARNPFTPLPGEEQAAPSTKTTGTTKTSTTTSTTTSTPAPAAGSGTSTSAAGGTTTTPPKETTPAEPKTTPVHYYVKVQFGVVPMVAEGAPPQPAELKTYKELFPREPLPGKADPLLVYHGVAPKTGKEATFTLAGEAILHGDAVCKPSATQCQTIGLETGQAETLEVVAADGSSVIYELKLLSIEKSTGSASAARAHAARRRKHGHRALSK